MMLMIDKAMKAARSTCENTFREHRLGIVTYAGFMTLAVVTFPPGLFPAEAGLDPSWVIGLHLGVANGFLFGKDILFTYGPLGYLCYPVFVARDLWMSAVIFGDAVHLAFFLLLAAFALRSNARGVSMVALGVFAPVIRAFFGIPYTLGAVILLMSYLAARSERKIAYLTICCAIGAFSFYLKTDLGILSLAIVLMATLWILRKHRCLISFVPLSTYVVLFVVQGILLTKNVRVFSSFAIGSMELAAGYAGAMSIDQMPSWFILFPLICLLVLIWFITGKSVDAAFLVMSLPFLFITFKHGFVREDLHVLTFFGAWSLFWLLVQGVIVRPPRRVKRMLACTLALFLLLPGAGVLAAIPVSGRQPLEVITSAPQRLVSFASETYAPFGLVRLASTADFLLNPQKAEIAFESSLATVRKAYALSNDTVSMLRGHTVDVVPWDVSLVYAYGLRWDPAPVFQAYSAYTPYLDDLNADHYEGNDSPDFVLYRFESIDGRYPWFDEPHAFRALTCNYDIVGTDAQFLIMKKRASNACGISVLTGTLETHFGETVHVPVDGEGPVVAKIFVQPNWLGRVATLLYKTPIVRINLVFDDGTQGGYRLVTAVAEDGLLLGPLFGGIPGPSVVRFTLVTDGPQFYEPGIGVEFDRLATSQHMIPQSLSQGAGHRMSCCANEESQIPLFNEIGSDDLARRWMESTA